MLPFTCYLPTQFYSFLPTKPSPSVRKPLRMSCQTDDLAVSPSENCPGIGGTPLDSL